MLLTDDFLLRLERLSIAARRLAAGMPHGGHVSRRRGPSVEFRQHRAYTPGDDPRTIDWNAAARLGHPFVKEFAAEEAVHVGVLIDASASMAYGEPPKIEAAQQIAAAVAYVALAGLDAVSVFAFADTLREIVPTARGKHAVVPAFRAIEKIRTGGRTDFRALPDEMLRGRTILFVVTDFYDRRYARTLRSLRRRRFEINLVHLISPQETRPPEGRLILEDMETGEQRRVTITPREAAAYGERFEAYLASLETFALENELNYVRIGSADPIEDSVTKILRGSRMLQQRK